MKRILAIWLPNWPIQRLVNIRPELRGQAVILDQAARRGREVATCSPMARKLGVRPGMPVAEATSLVRKAAEKRERVPIVRSTLRAVPAIGIRPLFSAAVSVHSEAHDPQADRLALEELAAWCHQYSPYVGLEEIKGGIDRKKGAGTNCAKHPPGRSGNWYLSPFSCPFYQETLLLDVTGIAPLFGGERAFVEQVARGFRRLRLTAQLALADTIGAAWAVSHYGCQNPLVAEENIAEADGGCTAIGQLPLAALRLPLAMIETLGRLGLQQIGELQLIPRVELQARFGTLLLKRLDQTFGAANEVIQCVQPPSDFTAQWLLEHPTNQRDAIQTVIERLVEQLAHRLADCGEGALQLVCRLDTSSDTNPTRKRGTGVAGDAPANSDAGGSLRSTPATAVAEVAKLQKAPEFLRIQLPGHGRRTASSHPAPTTTFEVGLFRPSAEPRHLMELVNMRMEQVKLTGPVNCISVQVPRHARLEHRQQGLFDQGERKSESRQVSVLVDRLAGRLGREAVVRCTLQSDAQPELAYREEPLVDQSSQKRRSQSNRSFLSPLDRPLHLLSEPLAIQVMAVAPAGPPIRFRYHNHDCQVACHWGPERVETGWWRRRGVQRDYYRVETKTGQRFWLFRQMQTGDWFLHGEFG